MIINKLILGGTLLGLVSSDQFHPELRRGLKKQLPLPPPINLAPQPVATVDPYIPLAMESCLDTDGDEVGEEIRLIVVCPSLTTIARSTNTATTEMLQILIDSYNLVNRFGLCDEEAQRYATRADLLELDVINGTMVMNVDLVGSCTDCFVDGTRTAGLYTVRDDEEDRRLQNRHEYQNRRSLKMMNVMLDMISDKSSAECNCNVAEGRPVPAPVFTEHADVVGFTTWFSTECQVLSMEHKVGAGFSAEDAECDVDSDCPPCQVCTGAVCVDVPESDLCCWESSQCDGTKDRCDTEANKCVECTDEKHCDSDEVCHNNECVECEDDDDCDENEMCTSKNECVECEDDDHCDDKSRSADFYEEHKWICVEEKCEECSEDEDCEDDDHFSDEDKNVCHDNECVECEKDKHCTFFADKTICHKNECVQCEEATDCDTSVPERCVDNVCVV
mmetsp:Transcript_62206/g.151689  ORF Transcript_62206/g.151689 Transcript_62206/m.151689 type:complete len:447 (-) Transcript_62206:517-1857(-)